MPFDHSRFRKFATRRTKKSTRVLVQDKMTGHIYAYRLPNPKTPKGHRHAHA